MQMPNNLEINKKKFYQLFDDLLKRGEDRDELEFWETIFDTLEEDEQLKLLGNLEAELKKLA